MPQLPQQVPCEDIEPAVLQPPPTSLAMDMPLAFAQAGQAFAQTTRKPSKTRSPSKPRSRPSVSADQADKNLQSCSPSFLHALDYLIAVHAQDLAECKSALPLDSFTKAFPESSQAAVPGVLLLSTPEDLAPLSEELGRLPDDESEGMNASIPSESEAPRAYQSTHQQACQQAYISERSLASGATISRQSSKNSAISKASSVVSAYVVKIRNSWAHLSNQLLLSREFHSLKAFWTEPPKRRGSNASVDMARDRTNHAIRDALAVATKTCVSQRVSSVSKTTQERNRSVVVLGSQRPQWSSDKSTDSSMLDRIRETFRRISLNIVLHPHSQTRLAWTLLLVIFVLYDAIMVPMQAFDLPNNDPALITMLWATQLFWSCDLILCFMTGVYVNDKLEMRLPWIAWMYIRSWFALDLAILLPTWIELLVGGGQDGASSFKLAKYLRYTRFLRLLRFMKCNQAVRSALSLVYTPTTLLAVGVGKNMVMLAFLNHMNACWFFLVGKDGGWVSNRVAGRDILYQYLTSMHWCLSNYQGTSDVLVGPSLEERACAVLSLWVGLFVLTFFAANLTNVMMQFRALDQEKAHRTDSMLQFLSAHRISPSVGVRVKYFLRVRVDDDVDSQAVHVLNTLPRHLVMDVMQEVHQPVLSMHPFFYVLIEEQPRIARNICATALTRVPLAPEEPIFEQTERASCMYFVDAGTLSYIVWFRNDDGTVAHRVTHRNSTTSSFAHRVTPQEASVEKSNTMIYKGGMMSEAVLWLSRWSHKGDLVAVDSPIVFAIGTSEFEQVFKTYPAGLEAVLPYAKLFGMAMNKLKNVTDKHFALDFDTDVQDAEDIEFTGSEAWAVASVARRESGLAARLSRKSSSSH